MVSRIAKKYKPKKQVYKWNYIFLSPLVPCSADCGAHSLSNKELRTRRLFSVFVWVVLLLSKAIIPQYPVSSLKSQFVLLTVAFEIQEQVRFKKWSNTC